MGDAAAAMPPDTTYPILRYIRHIADADEIRRLPDGELLRRYATRGDEAAFEMLVHRHSAMVWRLCRQMVGEAHAAEDAFQATFFILVRKAGTIARPEQLGNWLYGVAHRVARRARQTLARRRIHEQTGIEIVAMQVD